MVEKSVVYKSVDGLELTGDLFRPKAPGLKPAVLVIHGGGWSKKVGDMESLCKDLVNKGYVVFNATYRLAPRSAYPKPVEDVRDALLWMKANAAKYEIDTEKISGWGYSAGAHLILLVGLDPRMGLKAIVAGGTPADLTVWPKSPLVKNFMGSKIDEQRSTWLKASPVNNVDPNSPPVFLYHGQWDMIVERNQMEKMRRALEEKKVPVETYKVPLMGHLGVYFFSQKSIERGIDFIGRQLKK